MVQPYRPGIRVLTLKLLNAVLATTCDFHEFGTIIIYGAMRIRASAAACDASMQMLNPTAWSSSFDLLRIAANVK